MAHIKKTIYAGALVVECLYPVRNRHDSYAARQGKMHLTSQAQSRLNLVHAKQKLELLLAANFVTGDLYPVLTYDDAHLPKNRKEALANVHAFWDRLRQLRAAKNLPLKYVYNVEHLHSDADDSDNPALENGRWHHHCIINATGDDWADIMAAWGDRGKVRMLKLKIDRDYPYASLAGYMGKERRDKLGHRLWSCSRNLVKPDIVTEYVGNDFVLDPPKYMDVLEDTGKVDTVYGHYRYLKYMIPGALTKAPAARRKRRKRKHCLLQ